MQTSLDRLGAGQQARVTGYRRDKPNLLQRLLEMGLTRGVDVRVLRFAPLGDPMEVFVRGYQLSVRLEEAALVEVDTVD